jgi:hypothetical protein
LSADQEEYVASRSEHVDELIASGGDGRGDILARLRDLIHEADPDIVEDVKWRRPSNPLGSATFEHDGIVCAGVLLKGRVRLSFFEGASLPDPDGIFNAQLAGNKSRAIDFPLGVALPEGAVKALVQAGVAYNRAKAAGKRK